MSGDVSTLPTVTLVDGAMYWVLPRYADTEIRWTVAKWEVGSFWGIGGGEVSPAIISGPIPQPVDATRQALAATPGASPGGGEDV